MRDRSDFYRIGQIWSNLNIIYGLPTPAVDSFQADSISGIGVKISFCQLRLFSVFRKKKRMSCLLRGCPFNGSVVVQILILENVRLYILREIFLIKYSWIYSLFVNKKVSKISYMILYFFTFNGIQPLKIVKPRFILCTA